MANWCFEMASGGGFRLCVVVGRSSVGLRVLVLNPHLAGWQDVGCGARRSEATSEESKLMPRTAHTAHTLQTHCTHRTHTACTLSRWIACLLPIRGPSSSCSPELCVFPFVRQKQPLFSSLLFQNTCCFPGCRVGSTQLSESHSCETLSQTTGPSPRRDAGSAYSEHYNVPGVRTARPAAFAAAANSLS